MSSKVSKVLSYLSANLPVYCEQTEGKEQISCLAAIEQALNEAAERLGFEFVRYSYWSKGLVRDKPEINAYSVNFSSFPLGWEELYNQEKIYEYDPVVRYIQEGMLSARVVFGDWCDAYERALALPLGDNAMQQQAYTQRIQSMIKEVESQGLYFGYFYSWGNEQHHIVLSLATGRQIRKQDNPTPVDLKTIHSIVILVNQAIQVTQGCALCQKMLRLDGGKAVRLTKMEIHILMLHKKHKDATLKQIAALSGRSIDTVNYHLRMLREKLGMPGASGHSLASHAAELNLF